MKRRAVSLIIILSVAAAAAVHALLIRHFFFVCDDAYISFRYLANWLAGPGLVYNPGERVEGYTNLGWVLALAPFARAGIKPETAAPALSIVFSYGLLGLVLFFPFLTRPRHGREEHADPDFRPGAAGLFAAGLLAANRSYNVWATGGLETRMFSFLTFAGLVLVLRGLRRARGRDFISAGICFALAELTRPEAMLLAATAFGLGLAGAVILKPGRIAKGLAAGMTLAAALIALHFLWRRSYYGNWLPNTYYVKTGQFHPGLGLRYLGLFGFEYLYWAWLGPIAWLIARSIRRRDPVPAALAAYAIPYLGYLVLLGGDHFEYRFLDPLLPVLALLAARAAVELTALRRPARGIAAAAILVISLYHLAFPLCTETRPPAQYSALQELQAAGSGAIAPFARLPITSRMMKFFTAAYAPLIERLAGVRWEDHRYLARGLIREAGLINEWIAAGYLDRSERFCIQTAGIIPYYTRLPTLDYFGLTNAAVARQPPAKQFRLFHEKKAPLEYLRSQGVDYIYLEISPRDPGDDPIARRLAIPLNDDEIEMIGGPGRTAPLILACSPDSCLLFATPRPGPEMLSRMRGRGLSAADYVPGPNGLFYPR